MFVSFSIWGVYTALTGTPNVTLLALRSHDSSYLTSPVSVSDVSSTSPLTPTTDTPVTVTQQLLSSASLDGSASSSASAVFEPIKSDPPECEY